MLRTHQPKTLGLAGLMAVLAALALTAIGASSASAATELSFLFCMPSSGGMYSSLANCEKLVAGGSGWEWETVLAGETATLDFTSGTGELLTAKNLITCTADVGTATVSGANTMNKVKVTFTGCKASGLPCNSTSPEGVSGEIITTELDGELVWLKSSKELPIGLLLLPAAGEGTPFTTLSCAFGLVKETVTGSVIGEIAPASVNKQLLTGTLLFEEDGSMHQLWIKEEEGATTFKLAAFGEEAVEVSTETFELLVGGVMVDFEIMDI